MKRLEKAEKFMQDRIKRMQKQQRNRQKMLEKNKTAAQLIKKNIVEGLEENKKKQKEKIDNVKVKQVQDRTSRSLASGMLFALLTSDKERLKNRLENERVDAQKNAKKLKALEKKEQELITDLERTTKDSKELMSQIKGSPYLSPACYMSPTKKKLYEGIAVDSKATAGSSKKTTATISMADTTTKTGGNTTFDALK